MAASPRGHIMTADMRHCGGDEAGTASPSAADGGDWPLGLNAPAARAGH